MLPFKCLKVANGILVLVNSDSTISLENITDRDVSIHVAEYGLLVKIKDIEIPIPESLIEYFIQNRTITIYPLTMDNYIEEPLLSVTIRPESLIEARGIYNFWKRSQNAEHY
jgi:hypothetical protein